MSVEVERRRKGTGSIYFDHVTSKWIGQIDLGSMNGKRRRAKVVADSIDEVEVRLRARREAIVAAPAKLRPRGTAGCPAVRSGVGCAECRVHDHLGPVRSLSSRAVRRNACTADVAAAVRAGACQVCGVALDNQWVIDHDHATGLPRGVICRSCNRNLAALDNRAFMARVAAYLERFRPVEP